MKFVVKHLKGTFIAGLFVVIPIGITGAHAAMPKGSSWPKGGRPPVFIRFGEAVHPQPGEAHNDFSRRMTQAVSQLLDEDRTTTRAYGLYHGLGIDALNIGHPATLVVDQERIVKYIYRGQNQHDRAPVELVLAAIRNLKRN